MMRLIDFRGAFEGQTVLLISSGRTTINYESLVSQYDNVVLINRAIRIGNLFNLPNHKVFFVSVHPEVFGGDPTLALPNVTACFPMHGKRSCSPKVIESGIWFTVQDKYVYEPESFRDAVRDVTETFAQNRLCAICNSAHVTLHLIYTLGCRDLHVVGAHEYKGVATAGYDPRLWQEPNEAPAEGYIKAFRDWAGLFDWNVTYLGE